MRPLITSSEIEQEVAKLGSTIADDYQGRRLTVLGVLTGSIVLLADLIRRIDLPLQVGLIQAASYRGRTTTPGPLAINQDFLPEIRDRNVLLIDDIFDTGQTLSRLVEIVQQAKPAEIRTAVLLLKKGRSTVEMRPDYVCFPIPDEFVVGYGLDYNDEYRHLPYIAALDESDL